MFNFRGTYILFKAHFVSGEVGCIVFELTGVTSTGVPVVALRGDGAAPGLAVEGGEPRPRRGGDVDAADLLEGLRAVTGELGRRGHCGHGHGSDRGIQYSSMTINKRREKM